MSRFVYRKRDISKAFWGALLLVYILLASLVVTVFHNAFIRVAVEWCGCIGLLVQFGYSFKIKKSDIPFLAFVSIVLTNMVRFASNNLFDLFILMPFLIWYFVGQKNDLWVDIFLEMILIADTIYALATIFFVFTPNLYSAMAQNLFPGSYTRLMGWYRSGCMPGLTVHYSVNGILISTGIMLATCKYIEKEGKKRRLIAQMGILVIALLLTGKRGPIVFSLMSVLIVYYFHMADRPKGRIFKLIFLLSVVLSGYIILVQIIPSMGVFVDRFISTTESGDVTLGRTRYWALALESFKGHPIFGIGWGQYELLAGEMYSKYVDAHNNYLQFMCEMGIIGFFAFVVFAIVNLYRTVVCYKNAVGGSFRHNYRLAFSLCFQIFTLLYSFTGNPFYTTVTFMTYYLVSTISKYYYNQRKKI